MRRGRAARDQNASVDDNHEVGELPQAYDDLAEFIERGELGDLGDMRGRGAQASGLRLRSSVNLAPWEEMVTGLLEQLAEDAGSKTQALRQLGVTEQSNLAAWIESPTIGMEVSVRHLANLSRERSESPRRAWRDVERYADLADAARGSCLRGDGVLDVARLRPRYSLELHHSWLHMVGELLGQVVADAGCYQRAAVVLAVPERRLLRWVRWFVSRGSERAARCAWLILYVGNASDEAAVDADLVDAVARGPLDSEAPSEEPWPRPLVEIQEYYRIRFGPLDEMVFDLLTQVTEDAGSIRQASRALGQPSSTLSAKLRRARAKRQR